MRFGWSKTPTPRSLFCFSFLRDTSLSRLAIRTYLRTPDIKDSRQLLLYCLYRLSYRRKNHFQILMQNASHIHTHNLPSASQDIMQVAQQKIQKR